MSTSADNAPHSRFPMNLLSLLEHGPVEVETCQAGEDGGIALVCSGADLELRDGVRWAGHRSWLSTFSGWSRVFDDGNDDCVDSGTWPETVHE